MEKTGERALDGGFVENKPKCVMIVVPHHPAPLSAAKRGFLLHARQEKQQFDSTDWQLLAKAEEDATNFIESFARCC